MYLPFILIVIAAFILLVVLFSAIHASYVRGIRAGTSRFFKKFRRRARVETRVVPDDRPMIFVSRPNTTIYYPKNDYTAKRKGSIEKTRYFAKENDKYRSVITGILVCLLIFVLVLFVISAGFLVIKYLFPAIGIPLSDSIAALINVTSNWNILTLITCLTILVLLLVIFNSVEKKLYFHFRPIYLSKLNLAEKEYEFEDGIIHVN